METAAYLYPWDVLGDPKAADVVAGLGLDHVVLAAVYHGTRAITPRHPQHRIVVAEHTAAYYRASTRGRHRPTQTWMASPDAFGDSSRALIASGVRVRAWAVVNHVDGSPSHDNVVNAFGDRYPWALCPARDAVLDNATGIATELAALPGIDGVELESCGWYGFDHLSAHDKTLGMPPSRELEFLLSLCFCDACGRVYASAGIEAADLRERVRRSIDARLSEPRRSDAVGPGGDAVTSERERISAALGSAEGARDLVGHVLAARHGVADRFRAAVVGELRASRPDLVVNLHASPHQHRSLSFTGVDPVTAKTMVDGLVVNCWAATDVLSAALAGGGPVHASLLALSGQRGPGPDLLTRATQARDAGAHGLRLYHAGLASDADLAEIRDLTSTFRTDRPSLTSNRREKP